MPTQKLPMIIRSLTAEALSGAKIMVQRLIAKSEIDFSSSAPLTIAAPGELTSATLAFKAFFG